VNPVSLKFEVTDVVATRFAYEMSRIKLALLLIGLLAATLAQADTPAFDRPGIAFSTQTLPAGSVDWEQGLPDVVHDSDQDTQFTLYSAGARIRVGLIANLELQIADALYNHLQSNAAGTTSVDQGTGDLTLALKLALPSPTQSISWAILGGVSLPTGQDPFTADEQQYLLAVSASAHLSDAYAAGFYVGATRAGTYNTYTLSPNFSLPLSTNFGSYIEAGYTFGDHIDKNEVAGGGFTWMVGDRVQLDLYALFGLTARSTDLQSGLGVSMYIP
jgi:hypothetical protein